LVLTAFVAFPALIRWTDATLYGVARALGKYLLETEAKPRVLIGMDTPRIRTTHCSAACRGFPPMRRGSFYPPVSSRLPASLASSGRNKFSGRLGDFRFAITLFHDNGVKTLRWDGNEIPG